MLWYEIFFHYLRIKNEPTSFLHARHVFVRNGANKISREKGEANGGEEGGEKRRGRKKIGGEKRRSEKKKMVERGMKYHAVIFFKISKCKYNFE